MSASDSELSWVQLEPSRHFVMAEDQARRCVMCGMSIEAGERYYASRTVDYSGVVRFHPDCAQQFARKTYA
jgi:hypothetical protein